MLSTPYWPTQNKNNGRTAVVGSEGALWVLQAHSRADLLGSVIRYLGFEFEI